MEQIIVRVTDKEKAIMLSKMLSALDFVDSVEIKEDNTTITDNEQDFFAVAGLWENRNITAESIRQEAWREDIALRASQKSKVNPPYPPKGESQKYNRSGFRRL